MAFGVQCRVMAFDVWHCCLTVVGCVRGRFVGVAHALACPTSRRLLRLGCRNSSACVRAKATQCNSTEQSTATARNGRYFIVIGDLSAPVVCRNLLNGTYNGITDACSNSTVSLTAQLLGSKPMCTVFLALVPFALSLLHSLKPLQFSSMCAVAAVAVVSVFIIVRAVQVRFRLTEFWLSFGLSCCLCSLVPISSLGGQVAVRCCCCCRCWLACWG